MTAVDQLLVELDRAVERYDLCGIDLHGARVSVSAGDLVAREVIDCVFGLQATLGRADRSVAGWRALAVSSDRQYEGWLAAHAAIARKGPVRQVKRWGGDFMAQRVDFDGGSIVRHARPFVGLTIFAENRSLLAYVRPRGAALNIPHFEHVCKYPLRIQLWRRQKVEVHAAACTYDDRGMLLMGFRRSGKTTLAMHLMSRGARMIGSDLGLLSAVGGKWWFEAIPHMCRITPETVADNACLREALGRFDMNRGYLHGPVWFDSKIELYAGALDTVFGRPATSSRSAIDCIIFPAFDPRCERAYFEDHEPSAATLDVRERLLTDRPLPDWLPFREVLRRDVLDRTAVSRLRGAQPATVTLHFGPSGSIDWTAFDARLNRLSAGPSSP